MRISNPHLMSWGNFKIPSHTRLLLVVLVLIVAVLVVGLGFRLIDGRSLQAYVVAQILPQTTMEDYEKGKTDMTDKSVVEIPDWTGELDPRSPIVSPLYGDMRGLPPIDLFAGTWEVFYTDIAKTYNKMKAAGVDVRLHVKQKMGHVYPLWPCPEGKKARKEIAEIISKERS